MFLSKEILFAKENYFLNEFNEVYEKMILLYVPNALISNIDDNELILKKREAFSDFAILIDSNNYLALNPQESRIMIQY